MDVSKIEQGWITVEMGWEEARWLAGHLMAGEEEQAKTVGSLFEMAALAAYMQFSSSAVKITAQTMWAEPYTVWNDPEPNRPVPLNGDVA